MDYQERWHSFFLQIWYDLSVKKVKKIFSQKNTLKGDISGIIKEGDIRPRKYCISSDRKIKDAKKVPMIPCIFMEIFTDIFIYCLTVRKSQDWNLTSSLSDMLGDIP